MSTHQRVAITYGYRSAFQKHQTGFRTIDATSLAAPIVSIIHQKVSEHSVPIQRIVFGNVVPSLRSYNIAREIVHATTLPSTVDATSVSRACTTSYQAVADLYFAIARGEIVAGIAGGVDCISQTPIGVSQKIASILQRLQRAKTITTRIKLLAELRIGDFHLMTSNLTESSTGLTMGQSAEIMATKNNISRSDQDAFALRSHERAIMASQEGLYGQDIVPVRSITTDNLIRPYLSLSNLTSLPALYEKQNGTITAGTSSPLADGAAAVSLVTHTQAMSKELPCYAVISDYVSLAVDPSDQLLIGPAYAVARLLWKNNLRVSDIGLFDFHEAFAAQVLSVLRVLASNTLASQLGGPWNIGEIPMEKINILGGSLALGHPFAATGARQIIQTAKQLKRSGERFAICSACAAGGLASAILLENPDTIVPGTGS